MQKTELTPEKLIKEIVARAKGDGALVIITYGQWQEIKEAYQSPLIERLEAQTLKLWAQREAETKELIFMVFAEKFEGEGQK